MSSDDIEKIALVFKAFSDPTRLKLIHYLSKRECICVCHLSSLLDVSQSAVSQHLRILRQLDLVKPDRRHNYVHYMLNRDKLEQYKKQIAKVMGKEFITL